MKLNIKNVEYMIAKNAKTEMPSGEIKIKKYEVNKNSETSNYEEYLAISIFGKIGNEEYPMHFVIAKPIDEYLKIEKYKSVNIDENDIIDSYMMIDGAVDLDLTIKSLKVTRFSNSLVYNMDFNVNKEYFGNAEFEICIE